MRRRSSRRAPLRSRGGPPAPAPILDLPRLVVRLRRLRSRRPGARVVLANGLFDLLHVGHLRYLKAARRLGDFLVVAVNDDRSARLLRGPGRPIVPARDRARLLSGVASVDAIVLFSGRSVAPILRRLRPEIHCKGTDYTVGTVPEREVVRSYGGAVRIAGDAKRHATSDIVRRIARRLRRKRRAPSGAR